MQSIDKRAWRKELFALDIRLFQDDDDEKNTGKEKEKEIRRQWSIVGDSASTTSREIVFAPY